MRSKVTGNFRVDLSAVSIAINIGRKIQILPRDQGIMNINTRSGARSARPHLACACICVPTACMVRQSHLHELTKQ